MKEFKPISFTVSTGSNPVPYTRTTQKQKYVDKNYKLYLTYKAQILAAFVEATGKLPQKMLVKDKKYYVDVVAYYKDKTHADTDNVAKGVNDAIFVKPLSDKYIAGTYDYFYCKENPRLCVRIREED